MVNMPHAPEVHRENLPETQAIPGMVPSPPSRVHAMTEREPAMPARHDPALSDQAPESLDALNRLIAAAAPMVEGGTRAVLGEGPVCAAIAFVGEQPGDQEDLQGRPFVGPAGQLLDRAMSEAGIDRHHVYV